MKDDIIERKNRLIESIPDQELRKLLFPVDDDDQYYRFLSDRRKYIDYVRITLYFVTLVCFKKFLTYKTKLELMGNEERTKEVARFNNAMVRLYNMFDKCYASGHVDFPFVENVILNLQIDESLRRDGGFAEFVGLEKYFSFRFKENSMGKNIFLLKKSMLTSKEIIDFEFDQLIEFFDAFPFLRNTKLVPRDCTDGNVPVTKYTAIIYGEALDMGWLILSVMQQHSFLYGITVDDPRVQNIENPTKAQSITAEYVMFTGTFTYEIKFSNAPVPSKSQVNVIYNCAVEDFFIQLRLHNMQTEKDSYFFNDFFFIENKYIKYLTLTISDLINSDGKRKVQKYYGERYPIVFKYFRGGQFLRWDEIFVFLMLEVGVYDLFTFLFKNTNLDYSDIKEALSKRFGENVRSLEEEYALIEDPVASAAMHNDNNIIHCKVKALILLATRLLTANQVKVSVKDSLASLVEIQEDFTVIKDSQRLTDEEKILSFANKLVHFNIFISVFYRGACSLHGEFKAKALEESASMYMNEYRGGEAPKNGFNSFRLETMNIRREKMERVLPLYSIKHLDAQSCRIVSEIVEFSFQELILLNMEISRHNTPFNEQFYDMTGRRRLFDPHLIQDIANKICGIFRGFERGERNIRLLWNEVMYYLSYMRDGSPRSEDPIERAIYPIIGTCSQTVISQDGYRYVYLSIDMGKVENRMEIKMLTNQSMNTGDVYYCIPNIKRCIRMHSDDDLNADDKVIWVNPLLIPYESYQPNVNAVLERLSQQEDYEQAAKLIYMADYELYDRLFSGQENAIKIIKILFDKPGSIFQKQYVRLLRFPTEDGTRGDIVAVATMYADFPKWDTDTFTNAFQQADVALTEDNFAAMQSVRDTFDDSIGDNYYVNDICVDPQYRGQGYAKFLLNALVGVAERDRLSGNKNIVLSVFEENGIALNLYSALGFIPFVTAYDMSCKKDRREKYYKMIKYI